MAKRLKILLTGSNGFLGDYLANLLISDDFEISKLLRSDVNHLLAIYEKSKEINSWNKYSIFKKKYDVIIHTASLSYSECEKDPTKAYLINNLFTEILIDYSMINNSYFIFFSSVQVYGKLLNGNYSEETKISPNTVYSISKAKSEFYLLDKITKNFLQGIVLRIGNVVGKPIKYDSKGWELFANSSIRDISINKKITIKNNPNLRRNFISINLLMNLLRKILKDQSKTKIYIPRVLNVTMGESLSLIEYAQLVAEKYYEVYEKEAKIKFDEKLIQAVPYSIIENKKLEDYFPSFRNFNLEENIKEILEFFKN